MCIYICIYTHTYRLVAIILRSFCYLSLFFLGIILCLFVLLSLEHYVTCLCVFSTTSVRPLTLTPPHTQCQLRVVTTATIWMIVTLFLPVFEWLFTAFYCLVVFLVHHVLWVHFKKKREHEKIPRQVSREEEPLWVFHCRGTLRCDI